MRYARKASQTFQCLETISGRVYWGIVAVSVVLIDI